MTIKQNPKIQCLVSFRVWQFLTLNYILDQRHREGHHAAPLSLSCRRLCSKDLNCKPLILCVLHTFLQGRFHRLLILRDRSKYQHHKENIGWIPMTPNTLVDNHCNGLRLDMSRLSHRDNAGMRSQQPDWSIFQARILHNLKLQFSWRHQEDNYVSMELRWLWLSRTTHPRVQECRNALYENSFMVGRIFVGRMKGWHNFDLATTQFYLVSKIRSDLYICTTPRTF